MAPRCLAVRHQGGGGGARKSGICRRWHWRRVVRCSKLYLNGSWTVKIVLPRVRLFLFSYHCFFRFWTRQRVAAFDVPRRSQWSHLRTKTTTLEQRVEPTRLHQRTPRAHVDKDCFVPLLDCYLRIVQWHRMHPAHRQLPSSVMRNLGAFWPLVIPPKSLLLENVEGVVRLANTQSQWSSA